MWCICSFLIISCDFFYDMYFWCTYMSFCNVALLSVLLLYNFLWVYVLLSIVSFVLCLNHFIMCWLYCFVSFCDYIVLCSCCYTMLWCFVLIYIVLCCWIFVYAILWCIDLSLWYVVWLFTLCCYIINYLMLFCDVLL